MPKFFVEPGQIRGDCITVTGSDVPHIMKVLRAKGGDELLLCDGCGTDYKSVITSMSKAEICCRIVERQAANTEPQLQVTLFQCLPKASKMEYIIQKTTELGITNIVPVLSRYCTAKEAKPERWQKIAEEAAKQCGRSVVPRVEPLVTFQEAVSQLEEYDLKLFPYENAEEHTLKAALDGSRAKTAAIFIGSEGGFSPDEVALAASSGAQVITLGSRILRTETAGLAVLSVLMYAFDELG